MTAEDIVVALVIILALSIWPGIKFHLETKQVKNRKRS